MIQKGGISILRNTATLYAVFFLSMTYILFLLLSYDFPAVFFFGLVSLVCSFFSRNMVVILSVALIITIILKMGNVLGTPYGVPNSETVVTTEIIVFDENGVPIDMSTTIADITVEDDRDSESDPEDVPNPEGGTDLTVNVVVENTEHSLVSPIVDETVDLMIPNYQSSIMLSGSTPVLDLDGRPIEKIPVDLEKNYGYEFNNPFSKFGQNCDESVSYSCF